jgi:hypothetical protein
MKTLVCLIFALAVAFSTAALADEVLIVNSQSSSNYSPWWGSSYDALRFMVLWEKTEIGATAGGYINKIEFNRSSTTSATFNNVRVYLGHSKHTALETTFDNNYDTFSPIQVLNASSLTVSGTTGQWWDMGIDTNKFNYDNTNNLIMEIRWRGDNGSSALCYRGSGTAKRMWATNNDMATTGSVFAQGQYIRLTIINSTGVSPTSLGRIKSLYN